MANLHAPGWVAAALRAGLSATAGLRQFREAGGTIRDKIWYKIAAEQKVAIEKQGDEMTKPLSSTPVASEIPVMTTKRKSGYVQTLDIYTRITGTDIVTTRPFWFSGTELMSRGEALTKALTMMQVAIDQGRYEEKLLGGVYTGTRLMVPGEVQ